MVLRTIQAAHRRQAERIGTLRGRLIPGWLVRILGPLVWIRPYFTDRCVACGLCIKSCPVEALTIAPKEKPALNPKRCIGCCCCHEVCPAKAILMNQSPFLKFVRRGRLP
jgi:formate hydrogenlyase subunit 6/NADH:ubiquinone oxidoreductase subunit I